VAIDDDDMFAECEEQGKMKKRKIFRIYWKTMKGNFIFCVVLFCVGLRKLVIKYFGFLLGKVSY
jgi:hypothetical protein